MDDKRDVETLDYVVGAKGYSLDREDGQVGYMRAQTARDAGARYAEL